ncbi:hypothetical protein HanIR_Chr10g0472501 [Helianthus annuus]|nr:hypothetical protein HanIR_Chr10g0472501 [Helianthus annuus]
MTREHSVQLPCILLFSHLSCPNHHHPTTSIPPSSTNKTRTLNTTSRSLISVAETYIADLHLGFLSLILSS